MAYSLKVLTIDDGNIVHKITISFLERLCQELNIQFNLHAYNDSVQGLFELSSNGDDYDMILMGVMLPTLSGDEIYNSILHSNPSLTKRITFITGYPNTLFERFPNETFSIIPKPFKYQTFCEALLPTIACAKARFHVTSSSFSPVIENVPCAA